MRASARSRHTTRSEARTTNNASRNADEACSRAIDLTGQGPFSSTSATSPRNLRHCGAFTCAMKTRLLLSCAALVFALTAQAQIPDQPRRPDPQAPPMDHPRGGPPRGRGDHQPDAQGDIHARLKHLAEAIEHLRAAGIHEPAASLEQMARQMQEEAQRQQRGAGPQPDRGFRPPMEGGRPPGASAGLEDMRRELSSLANQVQELRNMIQGQRGDPQRFARPSEPPRDGDRRAEDREGPPRRQEAPPQGERRPQDGERRREGAQEGNRRETPRDGASRPPAEAAPAVETPAAPKP